MINTMKLIKNSVSIRIELWSSLNHYLKSLLKTGDQSEIEKLCGKIKP